MLASLIRYITGIGRAEKCNVAVRDRDHGEGYDHRSQKPHGSAVVMPSPAFLFEFVVANPLDSFTTGKRPNFIRFAVLYQMIT